MRRRIEPVISIIILALILFFVFVGITRGQSGASGGPFTVEKQVVAGGGNAMTQSNLDHGGTGGQTVAGIRSTGGSFQIYSGFWTPEDFAPTAATAVISGRVKTADGLGIRNARLTVTFPDGTIHEVVSGSLGTYQFAGIPVGATYVITVTSNRFRFASQTILTEVNGDVSGVDFIALE